MKKYLFVLFIFLISLQAQAFEDYIIVTNGKLTDISIEDNTVIDVYPLITIMNDKNTLIVTPLKEGKTRFCVLKNKKDKIMFNVEIEADKTTIDAVEGFEILSIDSPIVEEEEFILDTPPVIKEVE